MKRQTRQQLVSRRREVVSLPSWPNTNVIAKGKNYGFRIQRGRIRRRTMLRKGRLPAPVPQPASPGDTPADNPSGLLSP